MIGYIATSCPYAGGLASYGIVLLDDKGNKQITSGYFEGEYHTNNTCEIRALEILLSLGHIDMVYTQKTYIVTVARRLRNNKIIKKNHKDWSNIELPDHTTIRHCSIRHPHMSLSKRLAKDGSLAGILYTSDYFRSNKRQKKKQVQVMNHGSRPDASIKDIIHRWKNNQIADLQNKLDSIH